jgi:hypothetical protein
LELAVDVHVHLVVMADCCQTTAAASTMPVAAVGPCLPGESDPALAADDGHLHDQNTIEKERI